MRSLRPVFKAAVLLEAGAAILFFGALVHRPELMECGARAIEELSTRGYQVPAADAPVRVYPAGTAGSFSALHAGGWRPGVISLRENPQGGAGAEVFLRHELMHEATFRACGGKVPIWAEEAAAMSFSGELTGLSPSTPPSTAELDYLRSRIRLGTKLDEASYRTLARLVAAHGWPTRPCAVSEPIEASLNQARAAGDTGFSGILVNLASGQLLEAKGDLNTRYPPGSLLKIPYAAALSDASSGALGEELARSDTERLLRRKSSFDLDRFRFLISMVKDVPLGSSIPANELAAKDDRFWRQYLGERAADGTFPFEANLPDLARMLRACLLYRPDYFSGLARNGFLEGSTLYAEPAAEKHVLEKLHALAKTGTVSDDRGVPMIGHLMIAWPADAPVYLAVFRGLGHNGAASLHRAAPLLDSWAARHPAEFGRVRVGLLTLTPRDSWVVLDECPSFERVGRNGWKQRVSICGSFRIVSSARGSRSERLVSGILESSPDDHKVVLITDPDQYAEAVLDAEAQELRGEGRKAMAAVIAWNATHAGARHAEPGTLCDTTHCMVFRGSTGDQPPQHHGKATTIDWPLVRKLNTLATRKGLEWLPFSKGGAEPWEKWVARAELEALVNEPAILDLRRERTRTGEVRVHLTYPESEETVPCEVFRNRLKLLSCPETIRFDETRNAWLITGAGAGHGQGLSVERARALASSGQNAWAILMDAFGR